MSEEAERYICLDCWLDGEDSAEMSTLHPAYCVHFTPEYWVELGYERGWGDASLRGGWPRLEILRCEDAHGKTNFVILAPHVARRPVILKAEGFAWGMY